MTDKNYPEDIRQYDSDPRSPFYDDSRDMAVDSLVEEIAVDILKDGYHQKNPKCLVSWEFIDVLEQLEENEDLPIYLQELAIAQDDHASLVVAKKIQALILGATYQLAEELAEMEIDDANE